MKDPLKIIAAIFCVLYILVQTFQWYVFNKIPETGTATTDFLNGARPLHIARSTAMLLSMFCLIYIYAIVCRAAFQLQKTAAILSFAGFFVFFLLEIMLRSVELFYFQRSLPETYLSETNAGRDLILRQVNAFNGIQLALYFPLMFSSWLSSGILICIFRRAGGIDRIILIVFIINFCRLAIRLAEMNLPVNLLGDALNTTLYLPLVILLFGLKAIWLLSSHRSSHASVKPDRITLTS